MNKHPIKKNQEYYLEQYIKFVDQVETISATKERILFSKYRKGDKKALQELVLKNQNIIIKIAFSFIGKGIELFDLLQEANLACILAINNYSYEKGNFKSYISRNIFRHLENITPGFYSIVQYPQNIINYIKKILDQLAQNTDNLKTIKQRIEDIRKQTQYTLLEYLSIEDLNIELTSISDRVELDLDSLPDKNIKPIDHNFILESLRTDIERALQNFDNTEQKVIKWYFGLIGERALTLEEIGDKLNLTRERIRQIRNHAIIRLKHRSRSQFLEGYLSLFYPDPKFINYKKEIIIHPGISNIESEKNSIRLLKKFVKTRRRKTSYPNIPNIAAACRKLIVNILKEHGEPCSYNIIKKIVYNKYPLLKNGTIDYALSTADNVINIHKGFYALKGWVIDKEKSKKIKERDTKKRYEQKLSLNRSVAKEIIVNEKQYKIINFILENQGNVTKLKLTVFSRLNHIDINQTLNSLNRQFYEKFDEPLVKEHDSTYYLNNKFIS